MWAWNSRGDVVGMTKRHMSWAVPDWVGLSRARQDACGYCGGHAQTQAACNHGKGASSHVVCGLGGDHPPTHLHAVPCTGPRASRCSAPRAVSCPAVRRPPAPAAAPQAARCCRTSTTGRTRCRQTWERTWGRARYDSARCVAPPGIGLLDRMSAPSQAGQHPGLNTMGATLPTAFPVPTPPKAPRFAWPANVYVKFLVQYFATGDATPSHCHPVYPARLGADAKPPVERHRHDATPKRPRTQRRPAPDTPPHLPYMPYGNTICYGPDQRPSPSTPYRTEARPHLSGQCIWYRSM